MKRSYVKAETFCHNVNTIPFMVGSKQEEIVVDITGLSRLDDCLQIEGDLGDSEVDLNYSYRAWFKNMDGSLNDCSEWLNKLEGFEECCWVSIEPCTNCTQPGQYIIKVVSTPKANPYESGLDNCIPKS